MSSEVCPERSRACRSAGEGDALHASKSEEQDKLSVIREVDEAAGTLTTPKLILDGIRDDTASHIGLYNANKRIMLTYGREYPLRIRSKPGRGTMVEMRFPS